jgi:Spy/CpxP family protein refolding chaperone
MKIFKSIIMITFLALGMLITSNLYAADLAGGSSEKLDAREAVEMGDNILNKLGLSEEQKKQLDANRANDKKEMRELFEKMLLHRDMLTTELVKPKLDMYKINRIQSDIRATQNRITDKRLNAVIGVRKIMTWEQFKKYIELTDLRKAERERRAGNERK